LKVEETDDEGTRGPLKKRDDLYEAAVDIVVREGRGSVSLLQRTLGIGYGRAARLIDYMAEDAIVGEYAGSQAREVMISLAEWEAMQSGEEVAAPSAAPASGSGAVGTKRRKNRISPDEDPEEGEEEVATQTEWDDGFGEEAEADDEDIEEDDDEEWEDDEAEEYEAESA
jgi:S-DNA-T family DNA segregation ATPase FtsK/SpoIIIE